MPRPRKDTREQFLDSFADFPVDVQDSLIYVGEAPQSPYETPKCESCFQAAETLVATLDGLMCAGCMEIQRAEAEAELREAEAIKIARAIIRRAEVGEPEELESAPLFTHTVTFLSVAEYLAQKEARR